MVSSTLPAASTEIASDRITQDIAKALASISRPNKSDLLRMSSDASASDRSNNSRTNYGLAQQLLAAEARQRQAAANRLNTFDMSTAPAAHLAAREHNMLAAASMVPGSFNRTSSIELARAASVPTSLRASQSLGAASIPPSLRPTSSMDIAAAAAMPPGLRTSQSLGAAVLPPSLARSSSIDIVAARRAAAMRGYGAAAANLYDHRRLLLAQQGAASVGSFYPGASSMFGATFGMRGTMIPGAFGGIRNFPNQSVSGQGLELLRSASMSLPNRMGGMGGMAQSAGGGRAMPPDSVSSNQLRRALQQPATPGFSPEASHSKKRKAKDDDSSDEEDNDNKIYIPEVRDLDILCGRGGKSNHHVGNKRYRQVVSEMKNMYRSTEAKAIKTDLSRAIVDHVCSYGGRFVKKEESSGRHYLLTKDEARKKTSQALRETKSLKWTM